VAGGGVPSSPSGEGEDEEGGGFTEPNIVPLVDIMLVLLVILMAGSSAIVQAGGQGQAPGSGFRVNLPSGTEDRGLATVTDELVITVLETGEVVIDDEVIAVEALTEALRADAEADPDRFVLVQADENAKHARVVEVMEAARAAGLTNLAIATRGAEPEE
jgi:biopolymer transport protein ExbD